MHRSACEKNLFTFDEVLLTDVAQTKSFSLPVMKIDPVTMSLFSSDVGDKKELLTARVKTSARRFVRSVAKQFAFQEDQVSPVPVAKRTFPLSTPGNLVSSVCVSAGSLAAFTLA